MWLLVFREFAEITSDRSLYTQLIIFCVCCDRGSTELNQILLLPALLLVLASLLSPCIKHFHYLGKVLVTNAGRRADVASESVSAAGCFLPARKWSAAILSVCSTYRISCVLYLWFGTFKALLQNPAEQAVVSGPPLAPANLRRKSTFVESTFFLTCMIT